MVAFSHQAGGITIDAVLTLELHESLDHTVGRMGRDGGKEKSRRGMRGYKALLGGPLLSKPGDDGDTSKSSQAWEWRGAGLEHPRASPTKLQGNRTTCKPCEHESAARIPTRC